MANQYGLNKAERLKAERAARALEAEPLPLELDFPYQLQPFDPIFFGVQEEWPRPVPEQ